MHLIADFVRRRLRASSEEGFAMLLAVAVLFIAALLATAALVSAESDIHLTRKDTAAKKAYYAAQAGINNYVFHLNRDSSYWTYCTTGGTAPSNKALNQEGSTANRLSVPGATEEEYAIQLLKASTSTEKCSTANPTATMIENGSEAGGTFRIESTGYSGTAAACKSGAETNACTKRTLVATFSNAGLLNYIYYTKYETRDPYTYTPAKTQCAEFRAKRPSECENINFFSFDELKGPIHTEDTAQICGTPTFGRTSSDLIEFKGGWVGNSSGGCGTNKPNFVGTYVEPAKVESVEPPATNASLKAIASTIYKGKTTIVLEGEKMKVTNSAGVTTNNVAWPTNGVIYVSNETCGVAQYTPYNPSYTADTGCGNVYVKGEYTRSLTIAAENDIIIKGEITTPHDSENNPTTGAVLGLIANNFVRVYHPLSGTRGTEYGKCGTSSASPEDLKPLTIFAAILALNHSFIVDNFDCGEPESELTVVGAIAQLFRGFVSTGGASIATGYEKNYEYDDRLAVESPPYFLNPVKAAWKVRRETLAPNP